MIWLPTFRRRRLSKVEAFELDCYVGWNWEAFEFVWLNFGIVISVRPAP